MSCLEHARRLKHSRQTLAASPFSHTRRAFLSTASDGVRIRLTSEQSLGCTPTKRFQVTGADRRPATAVRPWYRSADGCRGKGPSRGLRVEASSVVALNEKAARGVRVLHASRGRLGCVFSRLDLLNHCIPKRPLACRKPPLDVDGRVGVLFVPFKADHNSAAVNFHCAAVGQKLRFNRIEVAQRSGLPICVMCNKPLPDQAGRASIKIDVPTRDKKPIGTTAPSELRFQFSS
jgi:hypothetical protein